MAKLEGAMKTYMLIMLMAAIAAMPHLNFGSWRAEEPDHAARRHDGRPLTGPPSMLVALKLRRRRATCPVAERPEHTRGSSLRF